MKIIDLLNKIANGEEVPKKIKYHDAIFTLREEKDDYINAYTWFTNEIGFNNLNDEVEIIKENKKIEKITINENGTLGFPNGCWTARNMDIAFAIKINRIIDEINKLKEGK